MKIEKAVDLKAYTTLGVGGPAEYFVAVDDEAEVAEALAHAAQEELPVTIIGGGSNLLVSDKGVSGLVIKNNIAGIEAVEANEIVTVRVGSGVLFDELIAYTVKRGWWGLENLSHIPGTVGATPVQNVGAYGVEVRDVIVSVEALDMRTGQQRTFLNEACRFRYRDSFFKTPEGANYFITRVVFALRKDGVPNIEYRDLKTYFHNQTDYELQHIRKAVIDIRSTKFPNWSVLGTAGSFFKNPIISVEQYQQLLVRYPELPAYELPGGERVKLPLGWILDKVLNIKGMRVGNVGTFEQQALVLVNYGNASAAEITDFANKIVKRVQIEVGIAIEWEVTVL